MLDEKRQELTIGQQMSAMAGLCKIISSPLLVVLRRWGTMGERATGGQMALGVFGLWIYLTLAKEPLTGAGTLIVLLVALAYHQHRRRQLERMGYDVHSLYTGIPWMKGDELTVKRGKEPLFVVVAGIVVMSFSMPLGVYLILAGFCHGTAVGYSMMRMKSQVRAMRDARHEQAMLRELDQREVF